MKRFFFLCIFFALLIAELAVSSLPIQAASSDFTGVGGNYLTRDEEDYNYLPILLAPGSSTGGTGTLRDQISYNLAFDQGYEVQCAKKRWNVTPQVYGAIEEYFEQYSAPVTLSNKATYLVDFENATVPLFRGDEDYSETKKISSFEGFFGASDPEVDQKDVLRAGVATQLLSAQQQCVVKYGNLFSLFSPTGFCSELENPDECAVNFKIEGSGLTSKQLYDNLSVFFSKSSGEEKFSCGEMANGWQPEYTSFGINETQFEKTYQALSLLPLNTDRLFRLAFLVISPQQNPDLGGDDVFSFLQRKERLDVPNEDKFAPIVIAFKVPHLATNHIISLPFLRDTAAVTSYGFRQQEDIEQFFTDTEALRAEYIDDIIVGKDTRPVVNCNGMPQCLDNDRNALLLALTDLINGSVDEEDKPLTCANFEGPYEQAGELGSPAKVNEAKRFKNDEEIDLISKAEKIFDWRILVKDEDVKKDINKERVPIMAHIVAPYGTDMSYLADGMKALFNAEEFERIVENNCVPDYNGECGIIPEFLTLGDAIAEIDSGSDSFSFLYDDDPECLEIEDPADRARCRRKSFGGTIGENPKEPLTILGGEIGFLIRKLQESLREIGSKTYEYVQSCERTEDLFLGRCQGFLGNPGGNDSSEQPADSCDDFRGTTVELPTMAELEKLVCNVASGGNSVAGQDIFDAQMLWGMMQVDGSPFLREIRAGTTQMSCGDLIINSCGASQIVGILVPHCIDTAACSQATAIAESEELRNKITPAVACSIEGSLKYILETRKNETSYLKGEYRKATGKEPTEKQLYYMYAARNYGLSPDIFTKDACQGAPPVQGCNGKNYCECVMDVFPFQCS